MFTKLLIANRGEIACRVIRTARRLGYRTVAVYSSADAGARHVAQADEAVAVGGAPATESYLNIAALIDAAAKTGADAVHPGYGFLSERAEFVDACEAAGLVFVGPPAAAMRAMGSKAEAKRRMLAAGVPCAPGYLGDEQSDERLAAEARALGLPLLVKAVAGGGGRGMRLVHTMAELPEALAGARREAQSAFGDGTLMLERLVEGGRHIEIQVFCDRHGNAVHLGERDCTAQRRRQKVIEEAPSPIVMPALREAMGRDAVAAARAVGYVGAGTVEFIVDAEGRHFFLEMNTRLQVEHPVTECITGLDLVEWQLRVAQGEPLPRAQHEIGFSGHAIEARLIVEDPYDGWKPQTGRITGWAPRRAAIRIDHGIRAGGEVTPYYDAMVAKFVAHGTSREDAIRRLVHALEEVPLFGVANNGRFLRDLLRHPRFAAATMTTTLLDEWAARAGGAAPPGDTPAGDGPGDTPPLPHPEPEALLRRPAPPESAWRLAAALRAGAPAARPASVARFEVALQCGAEVRRMLAPPDGLQIVSRSADTVRYVEGGVQRRAFYVDDGERLQLAFEGAVHTFAEPSPVPRSEAAADARRARAPVAGVVARLAVAAGDTVTPGQPLVCVEAMKMEMWLHAGAAGIVRRVLVAERQTVAAGALLVELEIDA